MTSLRIVAFAIVFPLAAQAAPARDSCDLGAQFRRATVAGEIHAGETFIAEVDEKLTFALVPTEAGWIIEARNAAGVDRSWITPPLHMLDVNPRNIAGWHFRNAANTGPNEGDVNAPQHRREFVFGPEPSAPPPSGQPPTAATVEPARAEFGRGELIIEDFGLADLLPGQRARMVYLKFSGCIGWIRGAPPAGLQEYSGVYRQGFEQSDFYTDDGRGPWWLQAEGEDWNRISSLMVNRGGRGSYVAARLIVLGRLEPFDDAGVLSSRIDTRIVVDEILSIATIPDEEFQTRAAQVRANLIKK